MNSSPIQTDQTTLTSQKTWFSNRWRSQVALQQALRDSPADLQRFFGTVALQDLASTIDQFPGCSLNEVLLPTIKRLELEQDFFPNGMDANAALTETALILLNSVQVTFGSPSFEENRLG